MAFKKNLYVERKVVKMKLPSHEEWMNDKMIDTVMRAKACSRPDAIAHLEERFCAMEAAAKNGASDKDIAEAGMPLTPEEFFALVFWDASHGK